MFPRRLLHKILTPDTRNLRLPQHLLCRTVKFRPAKDKSLPVFQYASETKEKKIRIYGWGLTKAGALGKSEYTKPKKDWKSAINVVNKPVRLDFATNLELKDIACGYGFTVMAVDTKQSRKVFGFGINTDSQIGHHLSYRGLPLGVLVNPVPIDIPFKDPASAKVRKVACGRAHTIIVSSEGVFSFGNNSYGQCGRKIIEDEDYSKQVVYHKIDDIEGTVSNVVCGQDHTLFLTEDGIVFSCGMGTDGQTGQGHYRNDSVVRQVTGDIVGEKIVSVSCRADTVLAVSDKGELFGWGNSEYRQLGIITDQLQVNTARKLLYPDLPKIKDVASAGTKCMVLDENGHVWVWGFGILGKGPILQTSDMPTQIPPTLFGSNEYNPDIKVSKIYAGLMHMAAINSSGDVYTWGFNRFGCLGLGFKHDQFFPLQVAVPCKVLKLSLGCEHTIAVCRQFA